MTTIMNFSLKLIWGEIHSKVLKVPIPTLFSPTWRHHTISPVSRRRHSGSAAAINIGVVGVGFYHKHNNIINILLL